ncbi:MAG: sugar ABC transporter substrate-binding protein, partial [Oscillibacter sp.]|nr:sugar ABC transporter substrate-binding protein [Oscillibacter sp.]
TTPQTAFFSEMGAMFLEGNWNLWNDMTSFPDMRGKWDIARLPMCPDPVQGDGRATISNGLCYSTAARGKTRDVALDVIKFFGTEEAQLIASSYGAAISAYDGTEQPYFDAFANAGYDLDLEVLNSQFEYGVQSVNNSARPKWKAPVLDELNKVYNGQQSFEAGMDNIQSIINTETAKKLADQ